MTSAPALTIGTLAEQAGVTVESIRFYQRKGLVPQPARPPGGTRRYAASAVARVRFIKAAQAWGFSLAEIAELLQIEDGIRCDDARRIAEIRLATVRRKIRELQGMAAALQAAVRSCRNRRGVVFCPIIASLCGTDPPRCGSQR
ncbi:MAG: MerR family transcriptional regulator [Vicinamibacterales bacterium]